MAVAFPGAPSAWAAASSATLTKMLGAQLPAGVTLAKASVDAHGQSAGTVPPSSTPNWPQI